MKRSLIVRRPMLFGFALTGVTWLLALTIWIQKTPDAFSSPSAYDTFPLFGLMAFSALLSTYVVNALSTYWEIPSERLALFYRVMGYAILILILSHPTTLITQLWLDGYGLPPASYGAYVSSSNLWVVYLGMISLFVFLSFELHRWFAKKDWWKWVIYANDVAMLLIFYHGMTLGGELQRSWFRYVWLLYGAVLVASIVYLRFVAKHRRV